MSLVLVAVLWLALAPRAALAADTVIGFDDQADGTVINSQYSSEGVTFDRSPSGPAGLNPTVKSDAADAHSPPNALTVGTKCGSEFAAVDMWASFAAPRNHVSTFVGNLAGGLGGQVTMQGYDLGGNPIPDARSTVSFSSGSGVNTPISVADAQSRISYVQMTSPTPTYCPVAIDNFSFDAVPAVIPPDFGLSAQSSSVTITPGSSSSQTLTLHRTASSTGSISLEASGLPSGVSASLNPNPTKGGDGSAIALTLTAASDAPTASADVTIVGTPDSTSGTGLRSVTVHVSVAGAVELRAQGLDVTQGILDDNELLVPSGGGSGLAYRGFTFSPPDTSGDPLPDGGPLVQGNRTVVRFYADAHGAPSGGVAGVAAQLYGSRNGKPLPGSPLLADYGPSSLHDTGEPDPAPVLLPERTSDSNAFTFTLPAKWTDGTISLTAKLVPYPTFQPQPYTVCSDSFCQGRMNFTLNDVSFITLPWVVIATLKEQAPGDVAPPASPIPLYQRALLTEPAANQFAILPYVGSIDPTPQVQADDAANSKPFNVTDSNPCPGAGYICNQDHNSDYLNAILDWGSHNLGDNQMLSQPALPADILAGINTNQRGVTTGSVYNEPFNDPAPGSNAQQATELVMAQRPLTSVAHETGHALGRNHADEGHASKSDPRACGGGGGPWPPDHLGYMQGIGLDTSVYPYRILYPGLSGGPSQWYDKMSYCEAISCPSDFVTAGKPCNEPDSWTSPYGWLHSISALWLFGKRTGRGPLLPPIYRGFQGIEATTRDDLVAHRATPRSYLVTATIRPGGGAEIDSVIPTTTPPPAPSSSPIDLVGRSASGQRIATVPMQVNPTHDDPGPSYLVVRGSVPATGVDSVQILSGGVVVASRTRSVHRPRIRVLAPGVRAVVGRGHAVTVRWKATGAKGDVLEVVVEYSADNGRHWRGIYLGPNRGHVKLPSAYFSRSRAARIRIVVNDGFNQVQAVSKRFRALGTPPLVSILDPAHGETIGSEATVYLHGEAFDDVLVPLTGRRLRWSVNGAPLGTGPTISATALPAGTDRITLRATDSHGRTGSASRTIRVNPVDLPFLRLSAPHRLGRRARHLTLRASSALTTTLIAGRHHYRLTRKTRSIRIAVPGGRRPLLLRWSVVAKGVAYPIALFVQR